MPKVKMKGGRVKHYPYTKEGKAAAKKAKSKVKNSRTKKARGKKAK